MMATGPSTLFHSPRVSTNVTKRGVYPRELPQLFAPLAFLRRETFKSYCIEWEAHERPGLDPCLDTDHLCCSGESWVSSGALLPLINAERRHGHL